MGNDVSVEGGGSPRQQQNGTPGGDHGERLARIEATMATREDLGDLRTELKAEIADTKAEIADTKAELKAEIADVRAEIADTKAELKADIADLKTEMANQRADWKTEIADAKTELKAEISGVRTELHTAIATMQRWFFGILVTMLIGIGVALVRLFTIPAIAATPPAHTPPPVVAESSAPRTPTPSDQGGT